MERQYWIRIYYILKLNCVLEEYDDYGSSTLYHKMPAHLELFDALGTHNPTWAVLNICCANRNASFVLD